MSLPPYEPPKRLPEGTYKFIISEYERRKYPRRDGKGHFVTVKFTFKVETDQGLRQHKESIACGEDRYKDLLFAIGATIGEDGEPHLSETVDVEGSSFYADIIYEPDRNDPTKTWARIQKIQYEPPEQHDEEDIPPPVNGIPNGENDEVPF